MICISVEKDFRVCFRYLRREVEWQAREICRPVEIYSRVFVGNDFRKFRIQWGKFFKRNDAWAGFVLVLVDVRVSTSTVFAARGLFIDVAILVCLLLS